MSPERRWVDAARDLIERLDLGALRAARVLPSDSQFMPVISYPSQNLVPPAPFDALFPAGLQATFPVALYVHVPFCRFACHYCHWIKTIGADGAQLDTYLNDLEVELARVCECLGVARVPVSSILIGGGTPTYLDPARLERLLTALDRRGDRSACRQYSVEAEPGTLVGDVGRARLAALAAHGVDRISLGVQSYEDAILQRMGRHHSGADARTSVAEIRRADIESLSIDLIYGYLGQQPGDWLRTLQTALADGVDAWHLYRLRIARHGDVQGPVLDEFAADPELFPGVPQTLLMKALGHVFSWGNGRDEHFTRIFARGPEHVTEYMMDYCCRLTDVIGLGPSSWGNWGRTFTLNCATPQAWSAAVRDGRLPIDRGLLRDTETDARRSLITPLKNDRVFKAAFRERLGFGAEDHFAPEHSRLEGLGLLTQDSTEIRLSERGRFIADEAVMQLFQRRYLLLEGVEHDLMPD